MPRYISHEGSWHPAKEKIGLTNITDKVKVVNEEEIKPGEPYIYDGPDRAALFELYKAGEEKFGENFRKSPEFLQAMRNQGFNSVDKFLKAVGYNKAKAKEDFEKKAAVVTKHELPDKVKAIEPMSGGVDQTSGRVVRKGGFEENGPDDLR